MKKKLVKFLIVTSMIIVVIIIVIYCNKKVENFKNKEVNEPNIKSQINFIVLKTYPHDPNSFTEGLFWDNGKLYESTGSPNELPDTSSGFGILNLETGLIDIKVELDKKLFFGEGIAKCKDKIYQLTYKNKIGFIYDAKTYKQIGVFPFDNAEGWGLTSFNGEAIIMSDGTNTLTYLDNITLKPIKKIDVIDNNLPVQNLNELEYVNGFIYANVYTTNKIVKIDPNSGNVIKVYDLTSLFQNSRNVNNKSLEMNGIAYNRLSKSFFITGKLWPYVYEIQIID